MYLNEFVKKWGEKHSMALKNTNDRYQYIFGAEAPKLENLPAENKKKKLKEEKTVKTAKKKKVKETPKKMTEAQQRVQENKRRFYALDRGFMVVLMVAIVMVAAASFVYVSKSAQLTSMARQVKTLKNEKTELLNKQATLQSEIDNLLDLEEISEYAQENLNLVYPAESKILYYQKSADDYFRQYDNVTTDQ